MVDRSYLSNFDSSVLRSNINESIAKTGAQKTTQIPHKSLTQNVDSSNINDSTIRSSTKKRTYNPQQSIIQNTDNSNAEDSNKKRDYAEIVKQR